MGLTCSFPRERLPTKEARVGEVYSIMDLVGRVLPVDPGAWRVRYIVRGEHAVDTHLLVANGRLTATTVANVVYLKRDGTHARRGFRRTHSPWLGVATSTRLAVTVVQGDIWLTNMPPDLPLQPPCDACSTHATAISNDSPVPPGSDAIQ
jgi:hypothetical protein